MAFEVGGNKSWHHLHCGASGECSRPTNLNRQMNVVTLIARYPQLYHMAEQGTWPAIRKRGLLSTTAVLDRYDIKGAERHNLESEHRAEKVAVGPPGDQVVLRDQKPMAPERLRKALPDHVTPSQWYRHLNGMVFLWAQEARLHRLLDAQHYRGCEHDVLTVDTASLVKAYEPKILLCHMNSGNTFPKPSKRDFGTFKSIADFPGPTKKTVVEVVVEYAIPDIASFVIDVRRMRGAQTLGQLPPVGR